MIKTDELSVNAKGGTELLKERLRSFLLAEHPELLENVDIYFSRVRDFDYSMNSVYYMHDLAEDPEVQHLKRGEYDFDAKVFVSWWQLEQYRKAGLIKSNEINNIVIPNSINFDQPWTAKFAGVGTENNPIRCIYHTTPHRGLSILVHVFNNLYEHYKARGIHIVLDVYSSFKIYGWEQRDEAYDELFRYCRNHSAINYMGTVSNEEIREALEESHVFLFPSIWVETSCLALIEAMASCNVCIHSSLGALPETSGGYTNMYPYIENLDSHASYFEAYAKSVIDKMLLDVPGTINSVLSAYKHVNAKNDWKKNQEMWVKLLKAVAP